MPTLLDEREITFEFEDLLHRRPILRPNLPPRRAPGLHQSGILRAVAEKIGVLKPGEPLEEDMPTLIALGMAWEEFAASLYPDMDWQPGELTVDGISVNCDGITDGLTGLTSVLPNTFRTVLEEFKLTFKKLMTGAEFLKSDKTWMWLHQARAYCYCYGPRVCRWHVCHVRGDYQSFGPVYKQYVVRFTDKEVEQSWKMLLNHRHLAKAEGQAH